MLGHPVCPSCLKILKHICRIDGTNERCNNICDTCGFDENKTREIVLCLFQHKNVEQILRNSDWSDEEIKKILGK